MAPSSAPLLGQAPGYAAAVKTPIAAAAVALVLAGCGANTATTDTQTLRMVDAPTGTTTTVKAEPAAATRVTRVVDGDTVVVSTGATVRLLGIDTPERGQCGYREATENMRRLTQGKAVTLTGGTTKDRYGRLVRYVGAGRVDAGLEQIKAGLATARYDSRDGYARHPKQDAYIAADKLAGNPYCKAPAKQPNPPPAPAAPTRQPPAVRTAEPVRPKPAAVYVKNCTDARARGLAPLTRGAPGYRSGLDRDGDGVACE